MSFYTCQCCGYKSLSEKDSYEICNICYWEDDIVQNNDPYYPGGANHVSLREAQRNFQSYGVSEIKYLDNVIEPMQSGYEFDSNFTYLPLYEFEKLNFEDLHMCQCCGYKTLKVEINNSKEVCRVCSWENSLIYYQNLDYEDECGMSLRAAQAFAYRTYNFDPKAVGFIQDKNYVPFTILTCQCCGYKTLQNSKKAKTDNCPVCLWINDEKQNQDPDNAIGSNESLTLRAAQANFKKFGVINKDWRVLDPVEYRYEKDEDFNFL